MFLAGVAQVEKTTKYNISASLKYRKVAFNETPKQFLFCIICIMTPWSLVFILFTIFPATRNQEGPKFCGGLASAT